MKKTEIVRKKWSEKELKYLTDNYATVDNKTLGNYFKRSWQAVQVKASLLGLEKDKIKPEKIVKEKQSYKSLPLDRWPDAEDFIMMMAKLKARLKRDNLAVESFSFLDLPKAFNQYQIEIGK